MKRKREEVSNEVIVTEQPQYKRKKRGAFVTQARRFAVALSPHANHNIRTPPKYECRCVAPTPCSTEGSNTKPVAGVERAHAS